MSDLANNPKPPRVLLIANDLVFGTKVSGTAAEVGLQSVVLPDVDAAIEALGVDEAPSTLAVIVDLFSSRGSDASGLKRLRAHCRSAARLIAYGPHVETERLDAAREAGCDEVMPRSKFSRILAELLRDLSSEHASDT